MNEYTVELRIQSADLEPGDVTTRLGLKPSLVRRVGERRSETTNWDEAMWAYNGFPESAEAATWPALEDGLSFLLDKLYPLRDSLERFRLNSHVNLWCGHFHSEGNSLTNLSPNILKRLADFGVELFIDAYCDDGSR